MKRKIDITKQDIRCCDDFDVDEYGVANIPYELWFDVDEYFGTNTKGSDNWVNFYTFWHPDGTITATYVVDTHNDTSEFEWELTEVEQAFFRGMMETYCNLRCGCTLAEMVKEVENW